MPGMRLRVKQDAGSILSAWLAAPEDCPVLALSGRAVGSLNVRFQGQSGHLVSVNNEDAYSKEIVFGIGGCEPPQPI